MNILQRNILAVACLATLAASTGAQQAAAGRSLELPGSADMADGEVRKVDKGAKKLTIKHGEIKSLDMPPMTMVFQVKDGALLDALKAGDRIRFVAEKTPSGYAVTVVQPAP